mmetsp:Transcript_24236/g.72725  ORF Transcript_24236/g.72725 Transcript_24236/m.72725 type:complete len:752 (-) Transcript_24236:23-2278(-)
MDAHVRVGQDAPVLRAGPLLQGVRRPRRAPQRGRDGRPLGVARAGLGGRPGRAHDGRAAGVRRRQARPAARHGHAHLPRRVQARGRALRPQEVRRDHVDHVRGAESQGGRLRRGARVARDRHEASAARRGHRDAQRAPHAPAVRGHVRRLDVLRFGSALAVAHCGDVLRDPGHRRRGRGHQRVGRARRRHEPQAGGQGAGPQEDVPDPQDRHLHGVPRGRAGPAVRVRHQEQGRGHEARGRRGPRRLQAQVQGPAAHARPGGRHHVHVRQHGQAQGRHAQARVGAVVHLGRARGARPQGQARRRVPRLPAPGPHPRVLRRVHVPHDGHGHRLRGPALADVDGRRARAPGRHDQHPGLQRVPARRHPGVRAHLHGGRAQGLGHPQEGHGGPRRRAVPRQAHALPDRVRGPRERAPPAPRGAAPQGPGVLQVRQDARRQPQGHHLGRRRHLLGGADVRAHGVRRARGAGLRAHGDVLLGHGAAHGREQPRRRRGRAADVRGDPPRVVRGQRPRRQALPLHRRDPLRRALRRPRRGADAGAARDGRLLQAARQDRGGLHGRRLVPLGRRGRLAAGRPAHDRRPPQEFDQAQGRRVHRHRVHGEGVRHVQLRVGRERRHHVLRRRGHGPARGLRRRGREEVQAVGRRRRGRVRLLGGPLRGPRHEQGGPGVPGGGRQGRQARRERDPPRHPAAAGLRRQGQPAAGLRGPLDARERHAHGLQQAPAQAHPQGLRRGRQVRGPQGARHQVRRAQPLD